MIRNPELQRHVWMELNPSRLLVASGMLGLAFVASWFLDDYQFHEKTAALALSVFVIANYLMGSHQAGDSLMNEVLHHTWDGQRLSAQSAWTLTWGKIVGANSFVWFISGVGLVFYGLSLDTDSYPVAEDVILLFYKLVAVGLTLHVSSLVLGLTLIRKNRQPTKRQLSSLRLVVFLAVISVFVFFESWITQQARGGALQYAYWYGFTWSATTVFVISLSLLLFWSMVAAWRLMGEELQMRQMPWMWLLFNLFAVLYLAGFNWRLGDDRALLFSLPSHGFVVSLVFGYIIAAMDTRDPLLFKRIHQQWQQGNWAAVLYLLPCWLVSLGLLTVWLVFLLLIPVASPLNFPWLLPEGDTMMDLMIWMDGKSTYVALYFFMVRDLAVILWLTTTTAIRRTEAAIAAYFAVIYLLLPFLVTVALDQNGLFLFLPYDKAPLSSILAAIGEAAGVLMVLYWGQRQYFVKQ